MTLQFLVNVSIYCGRTIAFMIHGLITFTVICVHAILLPKKGINGWTREPKSKYYEFRGGIKTFLTLTINIYRSLTFISIS
ncbi:MAG: hypothetical protein ACKVOU_02800 [Cytophagales bacterium]